MAQRASQRTTRIELRCTPGERLVFEAHAKAAGCSLSALVRRVLDSHGDKTPLVAPSLLYQIAAIGNTLNQLAKWSNTNKSDASSLQVLKALENLHGEIVKLTQGGPC